MTKKFRQPQPDKGKRVGISDADVAAPDWRKNHPTFSLQYTVPGYCIADCDQEQKAAFANTLLQLGKRKWMDILQADKHGSGTEKIPRNQMKVAIPNYVSPDREFFTVVRFWKKSPMIGYVHQGVYFILWLDKEHKCY